MQLSADGSSVSGTRVPSDNKLDISNADRRVRFASSIIRKNPLRQSELSMSDVDENVVNEAFVIMKQPMGDQQKQGSLSERKTPRSLVEEATLDFVSGCTVACCLPCMSFSYSVAMEYERLVLFRLGRRRRGKAKGPGPIFINPFMDEYATVDMRIVSVNIKPQEIMTQDAIKVLVDGIVFYQAVDPVACSCEVADYKGATEKMAASTLRLVLGRYTLSDLLEKKEDILFELGVLLDKATQIWGVLILRVELLNIWLPTDMVRSMATEAETAKLAAAGIQLSKGEEKAAEHIGKASACLDHPSAIPLRSLETLARISQKKPTKILFPLPMPFDAFWNWSTGKKGILDMSSGESKKKDSWTLNDTQGETEC